MLLNNKKTDLESAKELAEMLADEEHKKLSDNPRVSVDIDKSLIEYHSVDNKNANTLTKNNSN
jgi:hypothetical protein